MPPARFNVLLRLLVVVSATSFAVDALPADSPTQAESSAPASRRSASRAATGEGWNGAQIVIFKKSRTLALYRGGEHAKDFPVVLGLVPDGRKRHENDARTPEGLYHVVAKRPHARWQWFLAIDYPNAKDRGLYDGELSRGKIPDDEEGPVGIGGSVGIHGDDRLVVQLAGIDWTKGCIALLPSDIRELAAAVPVGTPVWIVE